MIVTGRIGGTEMTTGSAGVGESFGRGARKIEYFHITEAT